jgi:hypothetical protein
MLLIQPGDNNFGDDPRRWSIFRAKIVSTEEIVLIDRLRAGQPVRTDRQLDGFEYRRFSGVVIAKQDGCAGK